MSNLVKVILSNNQLIEVDYENAGSLTKAFLKNGIGFNDSTDKLVKVIMPKDTPPQHVKEVKNQLPSFGIPEANFSFDEEESWERLAFGGGESLNTEASAIEKGVQPADFERYFALIEGIKNASKELSKLAPKARVSFTLPIKDKYRTK